MLAKKGPQVLEQLQLQLQNNFKAALWLKQHPNITKEEIQKTIYEKSKEISAIEINTDFSMEKQPNYTKYNYKDLILHRITQILTII